MPAAGCRTQPGGIVDPSVPVDAGGRSRGALPGRWRAAHDARRATTKIRRNGSTVPYGAAGYAARGRVPYSQPLDPDDYVIVD